MTCGVLFSVTEFIHGLSKINTPIPCPVDRDDIVLLSLLFYCFKDKLVATVTHVPVVHVYTFS